MREIRCVTWKAWLIKAIQKKAEEKNMSFSRYTENIITEYEKSNNKR